MTLDEHGCVCFSRDGSGGVTEAFVDPVPVAHVVDTTGAGDSFAAGLAYGYLAYGDYVGLPVRQRDGRSALYRPGTDLDVYLSREETERQIRATYGPGSS